VEEEPEADITLLDANPPQEGLVFFQTDRSSDLDKFGMAHVVTGNLRKVVEALGAKYKSIKSE
jgi:hypothetical protein